MGGGNDGYRANIGQSAGESLGAVLIRVDEEDRHLCWLLRLVMGRESRVPRTVVRCHRKSGTPVPGLLAQLEVPPPYSRKEWLAHYSQEAALAVSLANSRGLSWRCLGVPATLPESLTQFTTRTLEEAACSPIVLEYVGLLSLANVSRFDPPAAAARYSLFPKCRVMILGLIPICAYFTIM
jgi:hypothetical protein